MRTFFIALFVLFSASMFAHSQETTPTGFLNKSITFEEKSFLYVVYVPRDFKKEKKLPVILFLHGAGERGGDGLKQSQVGIGTAIRSNPDRWNAIVVMPQCPTGQSWSGKTAEAALKALDTTVEEYNGDKDRLYLTGLSMGGFGSWEISTKYPDKFAAVVPICGGAADVNATASQVKKLPIWVFHGDMDFAVRVDLSRNVVKAIKDAGSELIKYTEYAGVGHNSWDKAYDDKEMVAWLFAQKRTPAAN